MFDEIPVAFWLFVLIAMLAFAPAQYVFRHFMHSPDRRDITLAPEDLSWRTSSQLFRSLAILAVLAAIGIFISTPAAEAFARSPAFAPILMLGFSAGAACTVVMGLFSGRIQPLIKGLSLRFERKTQPKRFWASLCWNAILACLFIWVAYMTTADQHEDRCYDRRDIHTPQETLAACDELLAMSDIAKAERADLLAARGIAYQKLDDHERALADYDEAIALDPKDSYSLYNRGLIYEQEGDRGSAIVAYSESLELRPDNADAYRNRGGLYIDRGQFDEAIADLTRAHELDPDDPWAIASRGVSYAWQGKRLLAERDFSAVRAIDPSNATLLRGEALLSMQAGDPRTAVDRLDKVLRADPGNLFSLNMRAQAYRQLGEQEKARADSERFRQLFLERVEAEIANE